jgi:transposase
MDNQPKKRVHHRRYDQNQPFCLMVDSKSIVKEKTLVKIVDDLINGLSYETLNEFYKGGGGPTYDPKMLLKVWLLGYCEGIVTSRKLAKALRENIMFMYLSGQQTPCFKTLSEFRGNRMIGMIDIVFKEGLMLLFEKGYIDLGVLYIDGTKVEANANKGKRIWAANTARYKAAVLERIELILEQAKALQIIEDEKHGKDDLPEQGGGIRAEVMLSSEDIEKFALEMASQLQKKKQEGNNRIVKEGVRLGNTLLKEKENLEKYELQERILNGRNSYSKTDEDATMFRMKDDRLLAAYNVQHVTNNQYVMSYTIEQVASDTTTLAYTLTKFEERVSWSSTEIREAALDAGYGSEENYGLLESKDIKAYMPYPLYRQEQNGELAKKKFRKENWDYDATSDSYTCPNEQKLEFSHEQKSVHGNNYEKVVRIYQSKDCQNCPFSKDCVKKEGQNRTVQHSIKGEKYKAQARELLQTEEGKQMMINRSMDVEPSFGDTKFNMNRNRFLLRGKEKVYVEYGLIALAHNSRKIFCKESGIWEAQYAHRAAKKIKKVS